MGNHGCQRHVSTIEYLSEGHENECYECGTVGGVDLLQLGLSSKLRTKNVTYGRTGYCFVCRGCSDDYWADKPGPKLTKVLGELI